MNKYNLYNSKKFSINAKPPTINFNGVIKLPPFMYNSYFITHNIDENDKKINKLSYESEIFFYQTIGTLI